MTGTQLNLYIDKETKKRLLSERERLGFSFSNIANRLFEAWMAAGCPLDFDVASQHRPTNGNTSPAEEQR